MKLGYTKRRGLRLRLLAMAVLTCVSQPALAQIEKYDAGTGKYVTSDPFASNTPTAPNPYRLNPRASSDISSQIAQRANTQQAPAANGGMPARAGGAVPAAASSQQFVPMAGMSMYGDAASQADPFAKPDWWPQ